MAHLLLRTLAVNTLSEAAELPMPAKECIVTPPSWTDDMPVLEHATRPVSGNVFIRFLTTNDLPVPAAPVIKML